MPNRIIKESICTSENIDNLTLEEETFFYRLMVNCDDFGRMDARPQILRAKCFPLRTDRISLEAISLWLRSLSREGLITIYEVDERNYLQMNTWEKHQQVRAKRSKFPGIDEGVLVDEINETAPDIKCNQMQSNVPVIENRESIYENRECEDTTRKTSRSKKKKVKFADFVSLAEEEHKKLVDQYGEDRTKRLIEILDNYKGSSGKTYKDDYRAILNWVVKRMEEEEQKQGVALSRGHPPRIAPNLTNQHIYGSGKNKYSNLAENK